MSTPAGSFADRLNRECDCRVVDLTTLQAGIEAALAGARREESLAQSHPHLFSDTPIFISPVEARQMQEVIGAVEAVIQLPVYRTAVLDRAPAIARGAYEAHGVFMGFDFHLGPQGPQLIEINTNAGGALLNLAARDAGHECCPGARSLFEDPPNADALREQIVQMFAQEWRQARGTRQLETIAIVDENPTAQYLYPEFVLLQRLLESRGLRVWIADPAELALVENEVRLNGVPIDLIYNRLTDFYFDEPRNGVLREAYERNLAVITPHPRAHALYADKRNLELLSDAAGLKNAGASDSVIATLTRGIPRTLRVEGDPHGWWEQRKQWFFKPERGFGSRGTYRGDKLTRSVFGEVMKGGYVAQRFAPPSERLRTTAVGKQCFKVDIRCYVYAGRMQLMAARLYQGQTTNFRSVGGGFAPVYLVR